MILGFLPQHHHIIEKLVLESVNDLGNGKTDLRTEELA